MTRAAHRPGVGSLPGRTETTSERIPRQGCAVAAPVRASPGAFDPGRDGTQGPITRPASDLLRRGNARDPLGLCHHQLGGILQGGSVSNPDRGRPRCLRPRHDTGRDQDPRDGYELRGPSPGDRPRSRVLSGIPPRPDHPVPPFAVLETEPGSRSIRRLLLLYAETLLAGRKYYREERFEFDLFSSAMHAERPDGTPLFVEKFVIEPAQTLPARPRG